MIHTEKEKKSTHAWTDTVLKEKKFPKEEEHEYQSSFENAGDFGDGAG